MGHVYTSLRNMATEGSPQAFPVGTFYSSLVCLLTI